MYLKLAYLRTHHLHSLFYTLHVIVKLSASKNEAFVTQPGLYSLNALKVDPVTKVNSLI